MTSEQAKQQGLYREAGRLAFAENQQYDNYGCHYGKAGVFATEHDLQVNAMFDNKKGLTP